MNNKMNKCPICRTSLNNTYFVKCNLLKEFIENTDKSYDIINFYSDEKEKSIIEYYSRNYNTECPICYEKLTEPRVLSCGHTLCSKCNDKIDWKNISSYNKYNSLTKNNNELFKNYEALNDLYETLFERLDEITEEKLIMSIRHKKEIEWKNRQHSVLLAHDRKTINYQDIEIKELKIKLEHLQGQNTSLKEIINVSPKYTKRNKICQFWLKKKCRFSDEKCRNAHGEIMLNTFCIN